METRQLLILQRNSLVEAMSPDSEPWAKVRARRLIHRIDVQLRHSDRILEDRRGHYGENGWQPEVERAVSLLEYRPSAALLRAGEMRETLQHRKAA